MLARAHCPQTVATVNPMAGRPSIWAGPIGRALVLDLNEAKACAGSKSDGDIIAILRTRPPWNKWSQDTLSRKLFVARQHHGDSPAPIADEVPPDESVI